MRLEHLKQASSNTNGLLARAAQSFRAHCGYVLGTDCLCVGTLVVNLLCFGSCDTVFVDSRPVASNCHLVHLEANLSMTTPKRRNLAHCECATVSGQFSTALCFASKNFSECLGPNNVLKRACLQLAARGVPFQIRIGETTATLLG